MAIEASRDIYGSFKYFGPDTESGYTGQMFKCTFKTDWSETPEVKGYYSAIVTTYIDVKDEEGNIIPGEVGTFDENGNFIATHEGYPFYTIGQRRGLNIGGTEENFVLMMNDKAKELGCINTK